MTKPGAQYLAEPPTHIRVAQDSEGFWTCREAVSGSQQYVREDLFAAEKARADVAEAERDAEWERRKTSEAVVDRIWDIFGRPSYEALSGRTIYDLITDLKRERDEAREALKALVACHDDFNASSGNMEQAYYKLAKYAHPQWDAARAALSDANAAEREGNT